MQSTCVSNSPFGGYDQCKLDGDSDAECTANDSLGDESAGVVSECAKSERVDGESARSEGTVGDDSHDSPSESEDSEADGSDSPSESEDSDERSSETSDACTLEDALSSMRTCTGTIWLIQNTNGSVGYAETTNGVVSFLERVLDDYRYQYGWESRVHIEWNLADGYGLTVEFCRTVIHRTLFSLNAFTTLETYHIVPCNPVK